MEVKSVPAPLGNKAKVTEGGEIAATVKTDRRGIYRRNWQKYSQYASQP